MYRKNSILILKKRGVSDKLDGAWNTVNFCHVTTCKLCTVQQRGWILGRSLSHLSHPVSTCVFWKVASRQSGMKLSRKISDGSSCNNGCISRLVIPQWYFGTNKEWTCVPVLNKTVHKKWGKILGRHYKTFMTRHIRRHHRTGFFLCRSMM